MDLSRLTMAQTKLSLGPPIITVQMKGKKLTVQLDELNISKLQDQFAERHIHTAAKRVEKGRSIEDKLTPEQLKTLGALEGQLQQDKQFFEEVSKIILVHGMMVATVEDVCDKMEKAFPEGLPERTNGLQRKWHKEAHKSLDRVKSFYGTGGVKDIEE